MEMPTTKSPDAENDTPPQTQPLKSLSFSSGANKKHHHRHHHHHPPPLPVAYKECLKNHAASLGAHALDGCGEFMPSTTAAPPYPTSLKCAACGCHRNFHRQESDDSTTHNFLTFHRHLPPVRYNSPSPPPRPPAPNNYSCAPHVFLALSTAAQDDHPHKAPINHHPVVATPATPTAAKVEKPNGRKRFRTKFSQEQKEKMHSFAEKLGWKMQKSDEIMVEEFCREVGLGKSVLKVWMHNNKTNLGRRENFVASNNNADTTTTINKDIITNGDDTTARVISFENSISHNVSINQKDTSRRHHHQNRSSGVHLHISTNGSSSSS